MKDLKQIPNTNIYVSETGLVFRLKQAKPSDNPKIGGYLTLTIDGTKHYVHRLVAQAFLPPPEEGQNTVHHKNGNVKDNRACNLEWMSREANSKEKANVKKHNCLTKKEAIKLLEELPDDSFISSIKFR